MLLLVLVQIRAWVVTIDLYGRVPWAEVKKTLLYKIGSLGAYQLFWPLFGIGAVLLSPVLFGDIERPSLIAALAACLVHDWVYHATPASVLLLGNSGPETLELRHRIERGIFPYRVVALFKPDAAKELPNASDVTNRLEWDNFRTVGNGDWRDVVHPLMDTTPLLVLDARIASKFVVEEAARVLGRYDLLQKTLFIGADGATPALPAEAANSQVVVTSPDGVIALLKERGLTRTNSPDDIPT